MGMFDKAFNKFAETGTSINRGLNKAIGKDVFGDINKIEAPREFADYSTFPAYEKEAPAQWTPKEGEEKSFPLSGASVAVSKELDTCIKFRPDFAEAANYYTDSFKFKYSVCVHDFDELVHYFVYIYADNLVQMVKRAHSLLLPFGLFDIDAESFLETHSAVFNRAVATVDKIAGVEISKNKQAQELGNLTGNAIQMQGGGFGFKGAMKGVAKAEAFNLGMGLLGKYVSSQMKMTPQQKAEIFNALDTEQFFGEVRSDYYDTFLTLISILSDKGLINGVKVVSDDSIKTMISNLKNPMFPKEKIPQSLATLISTYPFEKDCYELAEQLCSNKDEVAAIRNYFIG